MEIRCAISDFTSLIIGTRGPNYAEKAVLSCTILMVQIGEIESRIGKLKNYMEEMKAVLSCTILMVQRGDIESRLGKLKNCMEGMKAVLSCEFSIDRDRRWSSVIS
jgi:hypothetical protein